MLADGLGFAAHAGRARRRALFAGRRRAAVRGAARGLRQPDRAGAGRARWRVGVVLASRRLPLGLERRDAAVRQPAGDRRRDRRVGGRRGARGRSRRSALGPRWLARASIPAAARALGLRSQLPDAALLALVALAAVAALTAVGALLATALLVVPAATTRPVHAGWRLAGCATVALAAVEGVAGLWLSVELNTPPGPAIAVLGRRRVRARRRSARAARRAPRIARAGRLRRALALAGRPLRRLGAAGDASRASVVATTTQLGDIVRAVGGRGRDVHQILTAQHRSARVRAAPRRRRGDGRRQARLRERRPASTLDGRRSSRRPAASPGRRRSRPRTRRCGCRARAAGPRRRASTRTGGTTRATRGRGRRDPRRAGRADPASARRYARNADALPGGSCGALDAGIAALHRRGAAPRSASSSPTTTRSATSPRATASRSSAP